MRRRISWLGAALVLAVIPASGSATNGYFSHGYGTITKGMAGAGVALAQDPLAGATNPAATAFLPSQLDLGLGVFNPNRQYTVTGAPSGFPGTFGLAPGTVKSGSRAFVIPHVAFDRSLGPKQAAGVLVFANGGMNTHYTSPTFGNSPTGVDLAQLFVSPTYARKLGQPGTLGGYQSIGVSAVLSYQRFSANGLGAFAGFSSDPAALTDKGYGNAVGAGARFGYLGHWAPFLAIGGSYQTRVWMSKFGSYKGLFCEGGDFDIPSNWVAGIAVSPNRGIDLVADVQRVNYSEVHAVGHPLLPNLALEPLGAEGGPGFGWKDVTTYKLGAQMRTGRGWTWRTGYSTGDQPVPSSEVLFNILAPGVIEKHATLGVSKVFPHGRALNVALMRAFPNTVTGPNRLEAPGQQTIQLRMDEWELEVGHTWSFE
jgi:long-chain fatty acid transport protein